MNAPDRYVTVISFRAHEDLEIPQVQNAHLATRPTSLSNIPTWSAFKMVLNAGNYENPTNAKPVGIGDGPWKKERVAGPSCRPPVHVELDLIDDVLPRHELFLLDEGEKKVEYEPETRMFHLHHSSTTPS